MADTAEKIDNSLKIDMFQNGLQGALFGAGFPGGGIPINGAQSQNVSQANPLFNNLRWYFISNFRQVLSELYCEIGLIQTIVNVPVDDGLRGGVTIMSDKLTPDQLKHLKDVVTRQGDLIKIADGLKWTRLFGGGGTLVLTDQDPATPLDVNAINADTPLQFRGVDMWELYFDLQNTEGYDAAIQSEKYEFYSYYGTKVHMSRVYKMVGVNAPSFLRPRLRGWGLSVVESLVRSVNQYLEGTDLIYELMDEAKIDVYGIKNLTNTLLNPNGTQQVFNRIQISNRAKDYQHAIVMDSEDSYEQKTLTFTGIADMMREVRLQVAADLRMPALKLFGTPNSGLNADDESTLEVYNAMIESTIRTPAQKYILQMLELRCKQLFGFIPDDLSIEFEPLRLLTAEQDAEVKSKHLDRLTKALECGAISIKEFQDACNKANLMGIQLCSAETLDGADQLQPVAPKGSDQLSNVPGTDGDREIQEAGNEDLESSLIYGDKPPTIESEVTHGAKVTGKAKRSVKKIGITGPDAKSGNPKDANDIPETRLKKQTSTVSKPSEEQKDPKEQ